MMFSFENYIDLNLIWGGLIAVGIFLYVLLDGFDLGIGILFPFAPSDQCRNKMMNSIAPFWDGNETWLVLGGGGLFAAFPLAYSILMPAFYVPIILMLLGLIFRGVAFEFRFKAKGRARKYWEQAFHAGSLLAAFMQGMMLGEFVDGISVQGREFSGGPFDWISAFSVMSGVAVVFGYALLGSTWLILKTEDKTHIWAKKIAKYVIWYVGIFMALVCISMPFVNEKIYEFWLTIPNLYYHLPIPLITCSLFVALWWALYRENDLAPFLLSLGIFTMGYIGLGVSMWPWIVPYAVTVDQAAAAPESLSIMLIGVAILLPMILAYTGYCYYVFRGKVGHESLY